MEILHTILDVPYLPLPNRIEVIATDELAPTELTKTAFMIPFDNQGRVGIAHNVRRGLEIAGGHVEPGETLTSAAHRECFEETGLWVSGIQAIGYLRMTSEGEVPDGWKYPHPVSYQQFFAGRVIRQVAYEVNDECQEPAFLTPDEYDQLNDQQRVLVNMAKMALVRKTG